MIVEFFYKWRFPHNSRGKWAILSNKINSLLANVIIPVSYKITKPPKVRKVVDDVIVSLTTYPPRIDEASLCIESLLRQTVRPKRLILWLAVSDYQSIKQVPKKITKLIDEGLEIKLCEDLKSYKKIYFSALKFPQSRIVTADDDFYYPETWLEKLINKHNQYPNCIVCHRAHRITLNHGILVPYGSWDWYSNGYIGPLHCLHILTGAGAIFPAGFFQKDFFKKDVFLRLAPTTDDMWVKAYALRKNTKVVKVNPISKSLIEVYKSQRVSLISRNQSDGNTKSLENLIEYFGLDLVEMFLEEENDGSNDFKGR